MLLGVRNRRRKKVRFQEKVPPTNPIKCMRPVSNKRKCAYDYPKAPKKPCIKFCRLCHARRSSSEESNTVTDKTCKTSVQTDSAVMSCCVPNHSRINPIQENQSMANRLYSYLKSLNKRWQDALIKPKGQKHNCSQRFKRFNSQKRNKHRARKNLSKTPKPHRSGKYFSRIKKLKRKKIIPLLSSNKKAVKKIIVECLIYALQKGILERCGSKFKLKKSFGSIYDLKLSSIIPDKNILTCDSGPKKMKRARRPTVQPEQRTESSCSSDNSTETSFSSMPFVSGSEVSSISKTKPKENFKTNNENIHRYSRSRDPSHEVKHLCEKHWRRKLYEKEHREKAVQVKLREKKRSKKRRRERSQKSQNRRSRGNSKNKKDRYEIDTLYFPDKNVPFTPTRSKEKRNETKQDNPQRKEKSEESTKDSSLILYNPAVYVSESDSKKSLSLSKTQHSKKSKTPQTKCRSIRCKSYDKDRSEISSNCCNPESTKDETDPNSQNNTNHQLLDVSTPEMSESLQKFLEERDKLLEQENEYQAQQNSNSFIHKFKSWIKYQHLIAPWYKPWFNHNNPSTSMASLKNSLSNTTKPSRSVSTNSCLICSVKCKGRKMSNYLNKSLGSISLFDLVHDRRKSSYHYDKPIENKIDSYASHAAGDQPNQEHTRNKPDSNYDAAVTRSRKKITGKNRTDYNNHNLKNLSEDDLQGRQNTSSSLDTSRANKNANSTEYNLRKRAKSINEKPALAKRRKLVSPFKQRGKTKSRKRKRQNSNSSLKPKAKTKKDCEICNENIEVENLIKDPSF